MGFATVLALLFALIGAGLLRAAARRWSERRDFLRASASATGTIVALDRVPDGHDPTYRPTVVFRTPEGREVRFASEISAGERAWRVGGTVAVRYLSAVPHQAEIDSFLALWLPTLVFGILGAAFALVGAGILAGLLPV